MKTLYLFLLLLTIVLLKARAHDYQTVYAHRVAFFDDSQSRIKGLRVDSMKVASDTILYPFATIQEVSAYCYSPSKASWIGEKVVIKADGANLFFNREGGVVTLKTRARLNEPWIAFQRADTFRVEASVQSVELGSVLGLSDSVKTIAFRVLDQQGNTVDHALNKLKLKISKRYGFVETLNFYLFPDIVVRYPYDSLDSQKLVGLTNPEVGVQNLTWFDVNGFNPGDELHVQEHNLGDRYFLLPIREYDNRCIYKYLERNDYADSIVYRYARKQSIETIFADSTTLETSNDTLKSVVLANPVFDKLPGEPIIESNSAYQMYMRSEEFLMKIDPRMTELYTGNGSCLGTIVGEGCQYEKRYINGLGGPYYSCSGFAGDSEERKLVYYKKGETEWGNRLVITDVSILNPSLKWNIGTHCVSEGPIHPYDKWSTSFLHTEGDTLMYEKHYKKLVSCADSLCGTKNLKSYIREDAGKVFLANKTEELTQFDFNLQQGDTMIMDFLQEVSRDVRLYIRVDSVKLLVLQDQKERKAQYVTVFDYYKSNLHEESINDVLVEGIGSLKFGLIYPITLFITANQVCSPTLLCFYSSDDILYSNPEINNCYLNTGIQQILQQPNLVQVISNNHGMLEIQLAEAKAGKLFIYDLNGKQVLGQAVNNSVTQFCLPSSGVYLWRFEQDKGKVQTGKVMVM